MPSPGADDERAAGLAVPDRGADLRDVAADRAADVAADRRADERADGLPSPVPTTAVPTSRPSAPPTAAPTPATPEPTATPTTFAPTQLLIAAAGTLGVEALPGACADPAFLAGYAAALAGAMCVPGVDVRVADCAAADGAAAEGAAARAPREDAAPARPRPRPARRPGRRPPTTARPTPAPSTAAPAPAPTSAVPTTTPSAAPSATFAPTAVARKDLVYEVRLAYADVDAGFQDRGGQAFADEVEACVVKSVEAGNFSKALAARGIGGRVVAVGEVLLFRTLEPSPVPSLAPTTEGYRLAGFEVVPPADFAGEREPRREARREAAARRARGGSVPREDVEVKLRAYGAASNALRFYDEDPADPGYALASDPGSASATKIIPAGTTTLKVMVGALRDRINNGASFSQSVDVSLDSSDPNYACCRFLETFGVDVIDVDESLISAGKFLSKIPPVTSGNVPLKRDENAATYVYTLALTSMPFAPVRLAVRGDVDAFESIEFDGVANASLTIQPEDWAAAQLLSLRGRPTTCWRATGTTR